MMAFTITINCVVFVIVNFAFVLALRPEQLIDMLKEQEQEVTPAPPKETQAVLLGQLLRKFLENNFRRMYFELYQINVTLSNITQANKIWQEEHILTTENNFSNVTSMIHDLHESIDIIRIIMPQINSIQKTIADIGILKNISSDVKTFRGEFIEDAKKKDASLVRLVQNSVSTALKVTDLHQATIRKKSCSDILKLGERENGIYPIWSQLTTDQSVNVYCDMETDGGGWTIIQRRGVGNLSRDDRPNFNRNWIEYENGFGSASGDYWLGLENIRSLTRNCPHELLINLTDWENQNRFAHYQKFHIGSKLDFYRLYVEGHSGNVDDSLLYHNKKQFSTFDEDNDEKWGDINSSCAKLYGGGWWYGDCLKSNLNGAYPDDDSRGRIEKHKGIRWNSWTTMKYSLKTTEMKIRPLDTNC